MPPHINYEEVSNAYHKNFLRSIEKPVICNRMELTREILDTINCLEEKVQKKLDFNNKVLLCVHRKDFYNACDLNNALTDKNFFTMINAIPEDPVKKMDDFEKKLSKCGALIIVYNHVSIEWVIERIAVAYKSMIHY